MNFNSGRLIKCYTKALLHIQMGLSMYRKPLSGVNSRLILENLPHRSLLRVSGEEVSGFLQGLITNDIGHLQSQSDSMYAMFLNSSGRLLYDTILYRMENPHTYLIECDMNISNDLKLHLSKYRIRKKIQIISIDDEYKLWTMFDSNTVSDKFNFLDFKVCDSDIKVIPDPRICNWGFRILSKSDNTWSDISDKLSKNSNLLFMTACNNDNYRLNRYRHGVAEGTLEMPPGKYLPLEANCDFLNGVSFNKGCYIGQELTARAHHTGVIRKRHMPIKLTEPITKNNEVVLTLGGDKVGNILGTTGNQAIGLLRIDEVLKSTGLTIEGNPCFVKIPNWWPRKLYKKRVIHESF